jgi:maleate cis-trans isomerase
VTRAASIGYISASDPEELGYDFEGIVPPGVTMIGASPKHPITLVTPEAINAAEEGLDSVAEELASNGANAIIISIAPLIYTRGPGYDEKLIARIGGLTGLPTSTNQTAGVEALRALGLKRIILVNPNTEDLMSKQVDFFERSGFQVVAARSLGIPNNHDIFCVEPETSRQLIVDLVASSPAADGVYLSGPCWRTLRLIEPIERQTGLGVTTALQAMVWKGLSMVQLNQSIDGFGRLMRLRDKKGVH